MLYDYCCTNTHTECCLFAYELAYYSGDIAKCALANAFMLAGELPAHPDV
jgi:hypothetical protein